jgi:23S rRNA-/tRNA-specific pseudouridylate synthase
MGRASHNKLQFGVKTDGKPAITEYQVKAFYPHLDIERLQVLPQVKGSNLKKKSQMYQGFSLIECKPHTGRTHQIRVHLAFLKHPLVGDAIYAGKKRQSLDPVWCPRHFLHASQLQFTHPRTQQLVTVDSPLYSDLDAVLSYLY